MKSQIPLYHHLKTELLKGIEEQMWSPDRPIPSEAELAQQYQVSRTTVRQAIGDLVSMGYLVRRQGKGTFVTERSRSQVSSPLYGFAEELRQRGHDVQVHIVSADVAHLPVSLEPFLRPGSNPVLHVWRTVSVDQRPVFHESSYIVIPAFVDVHSLVKSPDTLDSVYGFLEQNGVRIGSGTQTIRADLANEVDEHQLGLKSTDPVLVVERVTQDTTGLPIEYSEVRYTPALYQLQIRMHRAAQGDVTTS